MGWLLLAGSFAKVKAQNESQNSNQTSNFRYIIAYNDINKLSEKSNVLHRNLMILMEKDAFNEENLKKLYVRVTNRFPKPFSLIVVVFTDIAELPTPEEREIKKPLAVSKTKATKTPWAIMFREKDVSRIDISANFKDMSIEMPK